MQRGTEQPVLWPTLKKEVGASQEHLESQKEGSLVKGGESEWEGRQCWEIRRERVREG